MRCSFCSKGHASIAKTIAKLERRIDEIRKLQIITGMMAFYEVHVLKRARIEFYGVLRELRLTI